MTPRERRRRGAVESLGSVVLTFESVVVFLGGLAVFGLRALPEGIEPWWGVVGGIVLAALMLATAGMLRRRWAVGVGWALQAVLALGGFLVPALVLVALIFGGMWAYATIKGAALDRRNSALADAGSGGLPPTDTPPNGD
jgi:hypothetical protein